MNGNDNITDREYTKKNLRLKKQALHGHAGARRSRPITGLGELPEIQKSQQTFALFGRPAAARSKVASGAGQIVPARLIYVQRRRTC
jgi:hypothetical protein